MKVLIVDNLDSFTYNLAIYLRELGADVEVRQNDTLTIEEVSRIAPQKLLISPGPGRPEAAGISPLVVEHYFETLPIMGVCLGHQCLAQYFGAKIERASRLMHGKVSPVKHVGEGVLRGLPQPFQAMRYHSLLIDEANLPECFKVTAWAEYRNADTRELEREIMAIEHTSLPLFGVQFHPESILSECGHRLLQNFLEL
ncbi:MAG: aminodeoxychorismate/anthranilate synthase component II [Agarilytica sp.]